VRPEARLRLWPGYAEASISSIGGDNVIEGLVKGDSETDVGRPSEVALLVLAARLAAVTAIALPVCGFCVRAIAFTLCGRIGSPGPAHLAAAQSIADLTVTALRPMLFALPVYAGALLNETAIQMRLASTSRRREKARVKRRRLKLALAVVTIVVGGALIVAGILLLPLFGALLFAVWIGTVAIGLRLTYNKRRSVRPAWTWPILAICLATGTVGSALDFRDVPLADYTIDSSSGVPSGWYLELGRSNDTIYLLSCTDADGAVVGVPSSSVVKAQYLPGGAKQASYASILDLIAGKPATPIGLWTICP